MGGFNTRELENHPNSRVMRAEKIIVNKPLLRVGENPIGLSACSEDFDRTKEHENAEFDEPCTL